MLFDLIKMEQMLSIFLLMLLFYLILSLILQMVI